MGTIKAYDIAGMFLNELGAPTNTAMRRAIAIWLRFESGGHVTGNNPWNLHSGAPCGPSWPGYEAGYCPGNGNLPGQIGNRYAGTGDRNVAVFRSMDDGVAASAARLKLYGSKGMYGYQHIIDKARAGDALGTLIAIQNSNWSAGHYSFTKLVSAFRSSLSYNTTIVTSMPSGLGDIPAGPPDPGKRTVTLPFGSLVRLFSGVTGSTTFDDALAASWARAIADIPGHVHEIMGDPNALPTDDQWDKMRADLTLAAKSYSGDKVSTLPDTITFVIPDGGGYTPRPANDPFSVLADALRPLGDIAATFTKIGAFLLDTENWLYIIALTGGAIIMAYGFAQLTGARMPSRPSVVPTEPIDDVADVAA